MKEELTGFTEGLNVGARENVGVKDDPRFGAWATGRGGGHSLRWERSRGSSVWRTDRECTVRHGTFETHHRQWSCGAGGWSPRYSDLASNKPLRAIQWHLKPRDWMKS